MSKRQMQEEKPGEEERVVAKSKLMMNFGVEDCQAVSKSTGVQCIQHPGATRSHSLNSDPTDAGRQLREV